MRRFAFFVVPLLLAVVSCSPNSGSSGNTGTTGKPIATQGGYPPPPCHPGCFPAGTGSNGDPEEKHEEVAGLMRPDRLSRPFHR
jgi:hypothetical protein